MLSLPQVVSQLGQVSCLQWLSGSAWRQSQLIGASQIMGKTALHCTGQPHKDCLTQIPAGLAGLVCKAVVTAPIFQLQGAEAGGVKPVAGMI